MPHRTPPSSTYDELPYHDRAFVAAHPDRLAVVGSLHGVAAPSVARSTVLELGCGLGGNLLPMAAVLPDSRFVGIDLSARQIDRGREVVERLGLPNLELRRQDLMRFEGEEGGFDYILCHGVFSWVPEEVQDRILALCARCLSPNGLAMISYNTLPGWRANGAIRDLLRYGARDADEPLEQVRQGLAFLGMVSRNVFDPKSPWGRLLQGAAERLTAEDPAYVFHEYLEEYNLPIRFQDFAGRAFEAGLNFVGDADLYDPAGLLGDEARSALTAVADDVVRCEQTLDFLRGRAFRRDVLCRREVPLERWPRPEALEHMLLVGRGEPLTTAPGAGTDTTARFRGSDGRILATDDAALEAALRALHRAGAGAVAYPDLRERVGASGIEVDDATLRRSLLACAGSGLVDLHTHLPPTTSLPGDRPRASRVARWQAAEGKLVVDPRHRSLRLDGLTAAVLALLDGTRDRANVEEAIAHRLRTGRLTLEGRADGGRSASRAEVRRIVADVVDALAGLGLLLDTPGSPGPPRGATP